MTSRTHFIPFDKEHSHLRLIMEGQKHVRIDLSKLTDIITEDEDPKEIADEIYEGEIVTQGVYKPYVTVEEPAMVDGTWIVCKTLNDLGKKVYESLEGGVLWDIKTGEQDIPATETFYGDMITKGSIDMRFVDLISKNPDDRLKDLKGKLVYFKMQGQRTGDRITNL